MLNDDSALGVTMERIKERSRQSRPPPGIAEVYYDTAFFGCLAFDFAILSEGD